MEPRVKSGSPAAWAPRRKDISLRAKGDLQRLASSYSAQLKQFQEDHPPVSSSVLSKRAGSSLSPTRGTVNNPMLAIRNRAATSMSHSRPNPAAEDLLHFHFGQPKLLRNDENSDIATRLSTVKGSNIKNFGNNLNQDQLVAACEMARRQKQEWQDRIAKRPQSYFKVSDEWAKRKGVNSEQMNTAPPKVRARVHRDHSHHYSPPPPIIKSPTPAEMEADAAKAEKKARCKHHHHKKVKHHREEHLHRYSSMD